MKISVVQTRPVKGDIEQNIQGHLKLVDLAVSMSSDMIVFPELSLTGYEPELARALAMDETDRRLAVFQTISNEHNIIIGVGVPAKTDPGISIRQLFFRRGQPVMLYSKQYLHPDEEPFFVASRNSDVLQAGQTVIAPAICYELSVSEHAERACGNNANIYLVSAVKFTGGIEKALNRLSEIARTYSMTVLFSNSVGICDGQECAGKTSIWNDKGSLLAQLDDKREGILTFDTDTQQAVETVFNDIIPSGS